MSMVQAACLVSGAVATFYSRDVMLRQRLGMVWLES